MDHFKYFNDTFGHQAGDEVLRTVASVLRRNVRESDIAGRYGGEEFGVVLVNTRADAAVYFAERLRKEIEKATVTMDGRVLQVTVSLGVAALTPAIANHQEWIEQADLALYRAKNAGRNRVSGAEES
ncbi:GGDEF domain-containing protein [Alkalilimnicola ehrlichii]|uniref:GGDEF domain-containing protein n=1 Tax=Alkalilimnicola ehrlichii TaxID=351052 RepID=UPI002161CD45|nr:GGDEF domain-containing protein [Alkalilimnicola ehrlichii]